MSEPSNVLDFPPKLRRKVCSGCGTEAACDCGVELVSATEFVKLKHTRDPKLWNVPGDAAAKQLGVGHTTLYVARRELRQEPNNNEFSVFRKTELPTTTIGKDGKVYPTSKAPRQVSAREGKERKPQVAETVRKVLGVEAAFRMGLRDLLTPGALTADEVAEFLPLAEELSRQIHQLLKYLRSSSSE